MNADYNKATPSDIRKLQFYQTGQFQTINVRSDVQRQDQERTHPMDNEASNKDHRETIELVRVCDDER